MTAEEKIIAYFEENEDSFNEIIEDLDSYNGFLGDDRYFEMEMLDEFYSGQEPTEILNRAFYGYDDTYTDADGNHPEPFNPNRPFFYYNGYGNLVSSYDKDYSAHLDRWFVESLAENRRYIYGIDAELDALLDEYEEEKTA